MNEPDFSGVEPLRLPEALRRVSVITSYLEHPSRTIADADRHASELGISRFQFYRLAKVWREHGKPSLLVGGLRGATSRDYGIPIRAIEIAGEEIAAAGSAAELATVAVAVETRCAAEGIAPPSRPTLWSYIMKARAESAAPTGPLSIAVGRFWFHLPMQAVHVGGMPMLLAAVLLPERIVVAHAISTDGVSVPDLNELVGTLVARRTPSATVRPLLMEASDRHAAAGALATAGLERVAAHPRSVQRALARAFGERLGPIKAIYRRGSAKPGKKGVIHRMSRQLRAEEAAQVITDAIDANNAFAGAEPAFDIATR